MKSRINRDEREISISELWWYVISKWKWLVIGMVVGALLMGAFGAYKAYSANNAETPKKITMEDLTEEEQESVKQLISDYEFYLSEQERLEKNYLMNLDYNYVNYCIVSYYIDTDYTYNYLEVQENYATTLVAMYKAYIQSDEVNDRVLGLNVEGLEISDLPYIRGVSSEGNLVKFGFLTEETDSKRIVDEVCAAVEAYQSVASELVGEHKLVQTSYDVTILYSEGVRNGQAIRTAYLQQIFNQIELDKANLSANQLHVYETEVGINTTVGVTQSANISKSIINVKYIIIGLMAGVVVVAIIFLLTYIAGNKIRSVNELNQVYGVELLGKIMSCEKCNTIANRKINKINKTTTIEMQLQYIADTLVNICKKDDIKTIAIGSTLQNAEEKMLEVVKKLTNSNIKCIYVGNINNDVQAMNSAVESKNVVIVEQMNITLKCDLENEIEMCDRLSINILGMIAII